MTESQKLGEFSGEFVKARNRLIYFCVFSFLIMHAPVVIGGPTFLGVKFQDGSANYFVTLTVVLCTLMCFYLLLRMSEEYAKAVSESKSVISDAKNLKRLLSEISKKTLSSPEGNFKGMSMSGKEAIEKLIYSVENSMKELDKRLFCYKKITEENSINLKDTNHANQINKDFDILSNVSRNFDSLVEDFRQNVNQADSSNQQTQNEYSRYRTSLGNLTERISELNKYAGRLAYALRLRRLRIWVDYLVGPAAWLLCVGYYCMFWDPQQ